MADQDFSTITGIVRAELRANAAVANYMLAQGQHPNSERRAVAYAAAQSALAAQPLLTTEEERDWRLLADHAFRRDFDNCPWLGDEGHEQLASLATRLGFVLFAAWQSAEVAQDLMASRQQWNIAIRELRAQLAQLGD